jgi:hypothetical protein
MADTHPAERPIVAILHPATAVGPVFNGKLNELQSAYGLLELDRVTEEIARRIARILTDLGRFAARDA